MPNLPILSDRNRAKQKNNAPSGDRLTQMKEVMEKERALTGLGLKFADLVVEISANNLYLALFLTMIASIILGMGMPTAALYIILATMVAPALVKLGVPVIAAHLFIFYYGCFAAVTPPVALSAYVAAAIAKADPFKTAFTGWKLALSAFIMPFIGLKANWRVFTTRGHFLGPFSTDLLCSAKGFQQEQRPLGTVR